MNNKRIYIVEDDEKLRHELKIFLENNGYDCKAAERFGNITNDILSANADLLLLDINLPGSDGRFLCREIRNSSDMPIIIITSRNNDMDELISLNNGADNYVTKPFNIQILLAKISNLLRRTENKSTKDIIKAERFSLNTSKCTVSIGGNSCELTKNEFRIILCLLQNKGRIVSRETIMQYLWEDESFVDDNTLTVNINRLRKKLAGLGTKDLITTRRGQGYYLNDEGVK